MSGHCEHCDLPLDQCEHGRGLTQERPKQRQFIRDSVDVEATTTTLCPACSVHIRPGDRIVHTEHGWVHVDDAIILLEIEPEPTDPATFEGIE